jgi:hypothetical protein
MPRTSGEPGLGPPQLSQIEGLFTAANQIFKGTGSGTGELIDFGTTLGYQYTGKGYLEVGTGAGTAAQLAPGSNGTVLTADSTQADGVKWAAAAGGGGILGVCSYAPASSTDKTLHSNTLAALDTTNLTVSFTAPSSGNVVVQLSGFVIASSQPAEWALFDHTLGTIVGYEVCITIVGAQVYTTANFYLTGLIPGSTYQYDWAGASSGGAVLRCCGHTTYQSGDQGCPALMIVYSA